MDSLRVLSSALGGALTAARTVEPRAGGKFYELHFSPEITRMLADGSVHSQKAIGEECRVEGLIAHRVAIREARDRIAERSKELERAAERRAIEERNSINLVVEVGPDGAIERVFRPVIQVAVANEIEKAAS